MTPTPEQELALNRAIWNVDETNCTPDGNGGYIVHTAKNYTRDLNAIVDVVQRWCEKQETTCEFTLEFNLLMSESPKFKCSVDIQELYVNALGEDDYRWQFIEGRNDEPALALCLAFAKAAGLKGEWE